MTVTVQGMEGLNAWFAKTAQALKRVPERFAARTDVQSDLHDMAVFSLQTFGIENTGVAVENLRVQPTADGFRVYEALNERTKSKYGPYAGNDPYILFFFEEYAPKSFLKPKGVAEGRDFFALWPPLMRSTVVDAFEDEVRKALQGR